MSDFATRGRAASSYREQEILNEGPTALVARLYEMTTLAVSRARAALRVRDWGAKGRAIHDASRSLSMLQTTLDLRQGGDVARNLDRLYGYLMRRLTEAHLRNDESIYDEILVHLNELGAAWREVANRDRPHRSAVATTAPAAAEQTAVAGAGA